MYGSTPSECDSRDAPSLREATAASQTCVMKKGLAEGNGHTVDTESEREQWLVCVLQNVREECRNSLCRP